VIVFAGARAGRAEEVVVEAEEGVRTGDEKAELTVVEDVAGFISAENIIGATGELSFTSSIRF
jgi:hypothetical protein